MILIKDKEAYFVQDKGYDGVNSRECIQNHKATLFQKSNWNSLDRTKLNRGCKNHKNKTRFTKDLDIYIHTHHVGKCVENRTIH